MSKRVFVLGNPGKVQARSCMGELLGWLSNHAEVVGSELAHKSDVLAQASPDMVIAVGGDGTILGAARAMGSRQIPIIGLNQGKLGFLAEFTPEELKRDIERVLSDESLISRRMILDVSVAGDGEVAFQTLAINDCVIHAGPGYRMIELLVTIDGQALTNVAGDGLIISSPSGSTAHNMSAGGPILEAGVQGIVVTPICPHSLTHRPVVVECSSTIEVVALRANEGTTVSIDGQVSAPLGIGDRLLVKRFPENFQLVRNPNYARWHTLVAKLNWGRPPSYNAAPIG